jgi:hypothetical protein
LWKNDGRSEAAGGTDYILEAGGERGAQARLRTVSVMGDVRATARVVVEKARHQVRASALQWGSPALVKAAVGGDAERHSRSSEWASRWWLLSMR